jgi:hypothetical protein
MAEKDTSLDGPGDMNTLFKPDGAKELPIKHYPSSGNMAKTPGKESMIEGPACAEGEHRGYHK